MTAAVEVCADLKNALEEDEVAEIRYEAHPLALGDGTWLLELPRGQHVGAVYGR